MFGQLKSFVLVAITVSVVMGDSTPALGGPLRRYEVGERYENKTGTAAECLIKYLYEWRIYAAWIEEPGEDRQPCAFTDFSVGDAVYTWVECTPISVGSDETVTVHFKGLPADGQAGVLCTEWYSDSACSDFTGEVIGTPVGTLRPADVARDDYDPRDFKVRIKHQSQDWHSPTQQPGDPLGSISGDEIYFAKKQKDFEEWELNEDLWTCHYNGVLEPDEPCTTAASCDTYPQGRCGPESGIEWEQHPKEWPTSFTIAWGEETGPFNFGDIKKNERVLFRYYTKLDPQFGVDDYEVIQFRPRDIIPAVSEWGLLVIALLILAAGTVVIRRRRAMAAYQ